MRLLGIDFETSGLDPVKDDVIEVGAVIWDTEQHQPLVMDNFFVNWGKDISPEITALNGVQDSYVKEFGVFEGHGLDRIMRLMARAEYPVAHNGELFDKLFFNQWHKRVFLEDSEPRVWIDSRNDIDFPERCTTRNLKYLAAEHGFLNPFAHRAVFDVLSMLVVLDKYSLEEVIFSAHQPVILIQALVSYDNRQDAKDEGFYWDGDRKQWKRSMKAHKYKPEEFKFNTRIIQA